MHTSAGEERTPLLDPVDRVSEILFGLIMAVTILGSLSIATAGKEEMRTVTAAALGCNLAWGLVDAVMYVVRTATGRARNRALAKEILRAEGEAAHRLMLHALPDHVAALVGPDEIEVMRRRLVGLQLDGRPLLQARDYVEAARRLRVRRPRHVSGRAALPGDDRSGDGAACVRRRSRRHVVPRGTRARALRRLRAGRCCSGLAWRCSASC